MQSAKNYSFLQLKAFTICEGFLIDICYNCKYYFTFNDKFLCFLYYNSIKGNKGVWAKW